jgi:hypothetical protein
MNSGTDDRGSALFDGDTGELPLDTRRVLVTLLLGPSLDGRRQNQLWRVLLRDEAVVVRRLHELFLELVIDRDQQVAFTRQVQAEDQSLPILLRRAPLTFLDSVLLLHLRRCLTEADARGERGVVSLEEMLDHLRAFQPRDTADHARFQKQMQAAVEKVKKHSLLQKLRGSEERYEISPTLKLLFSAEQIEALTVVYRRLASDEDSAGADGGNAPDVGDESEAELATVRDVPGNGSP